MKPSPENVTLARLYVYLPHAATKHLALPCRWGSLEHCMSMNHHVRSWGPPILAQSHP